MVKLTGLKKIKTAIFISGAGSNLKSLIEFSKTKKSPILVELIVSSNPFAKGLDFAKQFNIKKKVFIFFCRLRASLRCPDVSKWISESISSHGRARCSPWAAHGRPHYGRPNDMAGQMAGHMTGQIAGVS